MHGNATQRIMSQSNLGCSRSILTTRLSIAIRYFAYPQRGPETCITLPAATLVYLVGTRSSA